MKIHQIEGLSFIQPYRESRRRFNKYFNTNSYLGIESNKKIQIMKQSEGFLDNVSRASSVKIRQSLFENESIHRKKITQEPLKFLLTKNSKTPFSLLQNPEIYNLISKHVQKDQLLLDKKSKNTTTRKNSSENSSKFQRKSFSIDQFKKTPKITDFSRQTFYRKPSLRSDFSSKKENQDRLHSNSNLNINSEKISLCKKTTSCNANNTIITCQVYTIKKRVGIDASIISGSSRQIKFRLILNQSDTKTFQTHWIANPEEFVENCVLINKNGIKLKLGVFNAHRRQSGQKVSRIKQNSRKGYLNEHHSFTKPNLRQNDTPIRVGNIVFCQQYNKDKTQNINMSKANYNLNDLRGISFKQQKNRVLVVPLTQSQNQLLDSHQFNNSSLLNVEIQQDCASEINN